AEVRERVPVRLPGTVLTESADGQWVLERLRDVTAANHPGLQVGELWQTTGLHDVETLVNGAPTEHVNGILHDSTDRSSAFEYRRGTRSEERRVGKECRQEGEMNTKSA